MVAAGWAVETTAEEAPPAAARAGEVTVAVARAVAGLGVVARVKEATAAAETAGAGSEAAETAEEATEVVTAAVEMAGAGSEAVARGKVVREAATVTAERLGPGSEVVVMVAAGWAVEMTAEEATEEAPPVAARAGEVTAAVARACKGACYVS